MDITDQINAVIAARGTTTIIYHGGNAPGAARGVAPIAISGNTLVARCLETNTRKTFKLNKVEMASGDPITPYSAAMADQAALDARSFDDWVAVVMPEIGGCGWHIALSDRTLSIHDFTRFGKPRVGALVAIDYREFWSRTEYDMDADAIVSVTKKSLRPWTVNGKSFGKLSHAFAAFLEHYRALKP